MTRSEAASEAAMFPRMIQMVARIVAAGIVSNPLAARMYVGGVGMFWNISEIAGFLLALLRRTLYGASLSRRWSGPARRNVTASNPAWGLSLPAVALPGCESTQGSEQR
jgi:hypothetical protein